MAYKKYIKRGGNLYGPYIYKSKREDGKVITEYVGKSKVNPENKNKFLWLFIPLVLIIVTLLIIRVPYPTGRVVLEPSPIYKINETITGDLKIKMKHGELVPANSIISFKLNEQSKEVPISELVSINQTEGNFYAEDSGLTGSGLGYGSIGEKRWYPNVYFKILVYQAGIVEGGGGGGKTEKNATSQQPQENATSTGKGKQKTPPNETNRTQTAGATPNETAPTPPENPPTAPNETAPTETPTPPENPPTETPAEPETPTETPPESNGLTGGVVAESKIVEGKVCYGKEFKYKLGTGESATIVQGSVATPDKNLSLDDLNLKIENGELTITTPYYESEQGFGKDYLTKDVETLFADLEKLNFKAEEGKLDVAINYDGVLIAEASKKIGVYELVKEVNATNVTEITNVSIIQLKDIPDITIAKNSRYILNLSEYFSSNLSLGYSALVPENISIEISGDEAKITPEENFTGVRASKIIAKTENASLESNLFNIFVSEANLSLETKKQIRLGKPVKWEKRIKLDIPSNLTIEIPSQAENISVKKIINGEEVEVKTENIEINKAAITGQVSLEISLQRESFLLRFLKQIWSTITGKAVETVEENLTDSVKEINIQDNATEYKVEYETPAPTANEVRLEKGKKEITLQAELPYTDVNAYTFVEESKPENIKVSAENYILVDNNNDSLIDEVDWIANVGETVEIEVLSKDNIIGRTAFSDIYDLGNGNREKVYSLAQKNLLVNDSYVPVTTAVDMYSDYENKIYINYQDTSIKLTPYYYSAGKKFYVSNISSYDTLPHTHIYDNKQFYKYALGIFNFSLLGAEKIGFEISGNPRVEVSGNSLTSGGINIDFSDIAKNYSVDLDSNRVEISGEFNQDLWLDPLVSLVSYLPNVTGGAAWKIGDLGNLSIFNWTDVTTSGTAYTAAELNTISVDNLTSVYIGATPDPDNARLGHEIAFNISEAVASINNITIMAKSNLSRPPTGSQNYYDLDIYIGDVSSMTWVRLVNITNPANTTLHNQTANVNSSISNYINQTASGDKYVYFLIFVNGSTGGSGAIQNHLRYVTINVSYNTTNVSYIPNATGTYGVKGYDTARPPAAINFSESNTSLTSAELLEIANDNQSDVSVAGGASTSAGIKVCWKISDAEKDVRFLNFTLKGHGDSFSTGSHTYSFYSYVWNDTGSSWGSSLATHTNSSSDYVNYEISSVTADYINSAGYVCALGVSANTGSTTNTAYMDYAKLIVFSIDTTPPKVTIVSPGNATYIDSSMLFNVTLNEAGSNCIVSLDNWVTNYTMTKFTTTNFNYTNSSIGVSEYEAKFWCNDTNGMINNTEKVSFAISASTGTCACGEGADCVINTACQMSDDNCTGSVCDFTSLILNATLSTGNSGGNTNNLTLNINNNFNITSSGLLNATGRDATGTAGGGGNITITSANVYVNGNITTHGGKATSSGSGGKGGTVYINTGNFNSTSDILSYGGNGTGSGSNGGLGGNITVNSSFFSANNLQAFGGVGTGEGAGGDAGKIIINSTSNITINNINSYGGQGGASGGGTGNSVFLNASAVLNVSSINSWGIEGGGGGDVNILTGSALLGNINSSGSTFSGGSDAGSVIIKATSSVMGSSIYARGGSGGAGAGDGGVINITGSDMNFSVIESYGGSGAVIGGLGGNITINSTGDVNLSNLATSGATGIGVAVNIYAHNGIINVTNGIDSHGGGGISSGQIGANQLFEAYDLHVNGTFNASGGAGGAGDGGGGGNISQYYCNIFINTSAIYDVSGGNGTTYGADGIILAAIGSYCPSSPPTFSNITKNQSYAVAGQYINFSAQVQDNVKVNNAWIQHNFDITNTQNQSQTRENSNYAFGSTTLRGQQFVFSQNVYAYQACIRLQYNTGQRKNVTVAIYDTNSTGQPRNHLANFTIANSSITSTLTKFCGNFTTPANLVSGTTYALVLSSPSSSSISTYRVRGQSSGNYYANGRLLTSTNSGSSWSTTANADLNFTIKGGNFPWRNESLININLQASNISKVKQMLWAGNFSYKWCANDSSNSINCSSIQDIKVYETSPSIEYATGNILAPPNNTKVNGNVTIDGNASSNTVYASLQYSNATVTWTNITGCEALTISSEYDCTWNTAVFSNDTSGYDIRIVPCSATACNTSTEIKHYVIDRTIPIDTKIVVYPPTQSSIRDTQALTLDLNVTDGSGAGMNTTGVFTDTTLINGSAKNATMALESGNAITGNWSFWNISAVLSGSATGLNLINFYAYDNATPTNNLMYNTFSVQIDNINPDYDNTTLGHSSSPPIHNNTNVSFQILVSDNNNLTGAIFSNNFSGSWLNNTINFTGTSSYAGNSSILYTGNYSYYFIIYDDAGNSNTTERRNIEIKGPEPVALNVSLIEPENDANLSASNVTFTYNYTGGTASACNLYIDDSLNSSTASPTADTNMTFQLNFSDGNYDWFVICNNSDSDDYNSETRNLNISILDTEYPVFSDYWDNNRSLVGSGLALFNVTLISTNGTVWLEINDTNYTSSNMTADVYNVSIDLVNGTYNYKWHSWGNGTAHNYNVSATISYTINDSDVNAPIISIVYPTNITYAVNVSDLNYTFTETNPGYCWHSIGNGTNSSTVTMGINFTTIISSEGDNTWILYCNDTAGNKNSSSVTFIKDTTAPNVLINLPGNTSYTTSSININITLNEAGYCEYSLNSGVSNVTLTALAVNKDFTGTNSSIANGDYTLRAYCNDTSENKNYTETVTFNINADLIPPIITIVSPLNQTYASTTLDFNVSLNEDGSWCGYKLDGGKSWITMTKLTTTYFNYTKTGLTEASHSIYFSCNDTAGNLNSSSGTVYFTIDTTPPDLTINSPTNTTYANGTNIVINITNSSDAQAVWWYNGTANLTYTGVIPYNFTNGNNIIYAFANDSIGNLNITNVSFDVTLPAGYVPPTPISCGDGTCNGAETCSSCAADCGSCGNEGGGCTSTCNTLGEKKCSGDYVQICQSSGSCLKWANSQNCTSLGEYYYCENGECISGISACTEWNCGNWSICLLGEQTRTCACKTNSSITRTEQYYCEVNMLNLIYSPSVFHLKVPKGQQVNFSVIAFEESSLIEDIPIIVDWYANGVKMKADAGMNSVASSFMGDNYNAVKVEANDSYSWKTVIWDIQYVDSNCTENWECEWSYCDNGYILPSNCKDLNNCGTNLDYPQAKLCSCTPKWVNCQEWSDCEADYSWNDVLKGKTKVQGTQFRWCDDEKKCYNSTKFKQVCNLTIPIEAKKTEWCNETYIEIYEKANNKLVSRVKEIEAENIKKVNIGLIVSNFTGYCDYCYDVKQDYNETGIDCGGNCPECVDLRAEFDWWLWLVILLWILLLILIIIYIYYSREEKESRKEKSPKNRLKEKIEQLEKKKKGEFEL